MDNLSPASRLALNPPYIPKRERPTGPRSISVKQLCAINRASSDAQGRPDWDAIYASLTRRPRRSRIEPETTE
jgi:hypothetical protein